MSIEEKKAALAEKLQKAVELELSTIPPYLTAVFSIKPGANAEVAQIIRSVFMEEMLHMVLASNILSAIGGAVKFGADNIPSYPCRLKFEGKTFKNREFDIHLAALSRETVEFFKQIELPEFWGAPEEFREIVVPGYTIGEFYGGIEGDLSALCEEFGEAAIFTGDPRNQVSEQYYWSGGGKPIVVQNLKAALASVAVIVEQGEGTSGALSDGDAGYFGQPAEVPHYFRFNEIFMERRYSAHDKPQDAPSGDPLRVDYGAVFPIKTDCKSADFPAGSELQRLNDEFNENYSMMLTQLAEAFAGNPRVFYTAIMNGMHNLVPIAKNIVQVPIPGDADGRHGAPSFEWRLEQI